MTERELRVVWVPEDVETGLSLFVRAWQGAVASGHLVVPHREGWITIRTTRDSLPRRLAAGPYFSTQGGNA